MMVQAFCLTTPRTRQNKYWSVRLFDGSQLCLVQTLKTILHLSKYTGLLHQVEYEIRSRTKCCSKHNDNNNDDDKPQPDSFCRVTGGW